MGAKMQLLEVVTGHSQFLSHFSIAQAMPTQPVILRTCRGNRPANRVAPVAVVVGVQEGCPCCCRRRCWWEGEAGGGWLMEAQ